MSHFGVIVLEIKAAACIEERNIYIHFAQYVN